MKKALTAAYAVTILVALSAQNAAGQGQRNGNGNSRSDAVAEPGELLVQFKANANDAHKNKVLAKIKGEELEKVKDKKDRSDGRGDLVLVKHQPDVTQEKAVAILQADPAVEFAEPNWLYTHQATSNDTYSTNGSLWGMYGPWTSPANQFGSNAAAAWAAGEVGNSAVYVGVIDEAFNSPTPTSTARSGSILSKSRAMALTMTGTATRTTFTAGISPATTILSTMAAIKATRMTMARTSAAPSAAEAAMAPAW